MRIDRIDVENFIGLKSAHMHLTTPIAVVCSANGAGKTSLRDALAFALTGELSRVSLKKEAQQLIRDGADVANVKVTTDEGEFGIAITKTKIMDGAANMQRNAMLPFVLDAQRFATLEPKERSTFLSNLVGVKMDKDAIVARLKKRELSAAKIDQLAPLLRGGFDAAHKEAKDRAAAGRMVWKTVTGEPFGSEKAKIWQAPKPTFDPKAMTALTTEIKHADVALESWQQKIGAMRAEVHRRDALAKQIPDLKDRAARAPLVADKIKADEIEHKRIETELINAKAAAGGGPRAGLVHDQHAAIQIMTTELKRANIAIPGIAVSAIVSYEREFGKMNAAGSDPAAAARVPALNASLLLMSNALANDRRDLTSAQAAEVGLEVIRTELSTPFNQSELDHALGQAEMIKQKRAGAQTEFDALRLVKEQADGAKKRTEQAAQAGLEVHLWEQIADALAPDGLPRELLAEALAPINDLLTQSALDTEWPRVVIGADMTIREALHERDYRLLSESERWRCDAMIAEAIAHLSGVKMLFLDGADVLDLQGRGQLLGWLSTLADMDELSTGIVFATLRAPPSELGEFVSVHWLEAGVSQSITDNLKEAA